jgi:hypothetical protein
MSCEEIIREIPLYCYGEVSAEVEESVEAHLDGCAECRAELARQRAFMRVLDEEAHDQSPQIASAGLLAECRANLRVQLARELETEERRAPWKGWFPSLGDFSRIHIPFRVPVGAMALIALGFFGARFTPEQFGGLGASASGPMFSNVRSIESDAAGNVQIAVDEVRRHMVKGNPRDPHVQELLLSAVREESNPGLRVESIGMLQNSADSEAVRGALLDAVTKDPNAGVRLKALEGLKSFADDQSVRRTLASTLIHDEDPRVRVQAIELLTAHRDDALVGVLQSAVQKEDNDYLRSRYLRLLAEMKASPGTY